jgi:hypothetical protein
MRLGNETVDPCSPRHVRSLAISSRCFLPRFSQSTGVWKSHQARFWESICPLVHQMRRRKIAQKTRSPRVRSLLQCGRFTSCYGMNPQRATHRKTTQILSLAMFKRIPWDQAFHNNIPDDRQAHSANELNGVDSCPNACGIDSLETRASIIHDNSWRHRPKARFS